MKTDWPRHWRNIFCVVGFSSIVVGIGAFDWRLGSVVAGTLLLAASIGGMVLSYRVARQRPAQPKQ